MVGSGCLVTGNYLEYRGTGTVTGAGDEPVVVTNNGSLHLDHLVIYGQVGHVVGLQNHTSVHIGKIEIEDDGVTTGSAPESIVRTRVSNTAGGRCYIGSVTGRMRAGHLIQLNTGTLDYVTIRNVDIDWIYDAATAATLSQWGIFTSCKGFDFRDWRVKIIDEDDALTTEIFQMQGPTTNLTKKSFWKNIKVEITNADEITPSAGVFYGVNLANSYIYVEGAEWMANLGPRVRELGWGNGLPNSANAIPSVGTWRQGQILYNRLPAAAGTIGWSGTKEGTFSSATDATGDTDGSTAVITGMTDTSDFFVGQYVTVSLGFASATEPYQIRAITATTMTLELNSNSSQTNVTVATIDPVFKTFGTIAA